jgi:type I restriction enzyme R subunit
VQFVFAGNDSEGLQYGTIGTPEKYFLKWKEDEADNSRFKLDKYLLKMCDKRRLIELMHDFVLFDGGVKKLPRVHQYFGIKAAQEHVLARYKGGIIWHTQGSGKSIVMVLLAKWILETIPMPASIVTDRDELDKQIEGVFHRGRRDDLPHQQRPRPDAQLGQPSRACCARWCTSSAQGMWMISMPSSRS